MRRWPLLVLVLLSMMMAVSLSRPGLSEEGDRTEPPDKAQEPAGQALPLPWAPKKIADTIEDLSCPTWKIRRDAIRRVVGAGKWIVPFLLVGLKNPDPLNRQEIAYCLGRIGDPVAVPSLLQVLEEEPRYDVLVYTVDALGILGVRAEAGKKEKNGKKEEHPGGADTLTSATVKAMDRASITRPIKELLAYELEKEIYGREVGPVERKVIVSREATVRHAASEALALLGDNEGVPLLIEGLGGNGWTRRDAAVRLRRLTGGEVDFGFHLDMDGEQIETVQQAWRAWWKENGEDFEAARHFTRDVLDVYMPRKEAGPGEGR